VKTLWKQHGRTTDGTGLEELPTPDHFLSPSTALVGFKKYRPGSEQAVAQRSSRPKSPGREFPVLDGAVISSELLPRFRAGRRPESAPLLSTRSARNSGSPSWTMWGSSGVGTPLEDVSGDVDGGSATVLWGGSSGMSIPENSWRNRMWPDTWI
jgi:hypothetical protein